MNDSKSQKNEVVKNLFERKSVRIFEDRPISPEDRLTILRLPARLPPPVTSSSIQSLILQSRP